MSPVYTFYIYSELAIKLRDKCHNRAVLIVKMNDEYKPDEYLPTIDVCPTFVLR